MKHFFRRLGISLMLLVLSPVFIVGMIFFVWTED